MPALHIIYASTSGHTEYVVQELAALLKSEIPSLEIELQRAEESTSEDLLRGDFLLLASGTWNTGSIEGQLNIHMHVLLKEQAKDLDLAGKNVALIALGDDRYFYTCRAVEHLQQFVRTHGGIVMCDPLLIVNEPYGQEEKILKWVTKLVTSYKLLVTGSKEKTSNL